MPIDSYVNFDENGNVTGVKSFRQMIQEENERVDLGRYVSPYIETYIPPSGHGYYGGSPSYGGSSAFSPPPIGPEPLPGC